MSVVSWGKPTLELAKLTDEVTEVPGEFKALGDAAQGTTVLETTEGSDYNVLDEDGNPIDERSDANQFRFVSEIVIKKGDEDPVSHVDGLVDGLYAFRLTPKDSACRGKYAPKCKIKVLETWTAADGERARLLIKALHCKDNFCVCNCTKTGENTYTYKKSNGESYTPPSK